MDRQEEIQAINEHISSGGAYKKYRMGQMFYTEEPSYREKIANSFRGFKKPRTTKECGVCGVQMSLRPSELDRLYCSRECSGIGAGRKKSRQVSIPCDLCGKIYKRRRSEMDHKHKYCGQVCANKANAGRNSRGRKTVWNGVEYKSIAAAAKAAGINERTFARMLK
jgi:hypothetical protein